MSENVLFFWSFYQVVSFFLRKKNPDFASLRFIFRRPVIAGWRSVWYFMLSYASKNIHAAALYFTVMLTWHLASSVLKDAPQSSC